MCVCDQGSGTCDQGHGPNDVCMCVCVYVCVCVVEAVECDQGSAKCGCSECVRDEGNGCIFSSQWNTFSGLAV